jgi:ADP-ribosylglycohydrolase
MLYEIGLGDAYGASFEFARPDFVEAHNDGRSFLTNPVFGAIGRGKYTDDTQMSLALAEVIVNEHAMAYTAENIADSFFRVFKRDPRPGYSSYLYKVLNSSDTVEQMRGRLQPKSDRSGACMRACPLGVYGSLDEIRSRAEIQARITHDSDNGVVSATAVAFATHYLLFELGPREGLGHWLNDNVGIVNWDEPYTQPVGNLGIEAAWSAISVVQRSHTYTEILTRAVGLTGDVDTTAAIAMGMASCNMHFVDDLHPELLAGFEDQAQVQRLRDMDERLRDLARKNGAPEYNLN